MRLARAPVPPDPIGQFVAAAKLLAYDPFERRHAEAMRGHAAAAGLPEVAGWVSYMLAEDFD